METLQQFIASRDRVGLLAFVSKLLDDQTSNQREVISTIPQILSSLPHSENNFVDEAGTSILDLFRSRLVGTLEMVDLDLRKLLYDTLWAKGEYSRAGKVLGAAKFDSISLSLPASKRAWYLLETSKAFFASDEYASAERYLKLAGEWVSKSSGDLETLISYKTQVRGPRFFLFFLLSPFLYPAHSHLFIHSPLLLSGRVS